MTSVGKENKKRYDLKYQKQKCKQIKLLLNLEKDADLIKLLEQQTNVNGFLKAILRKHIETEKGETE